MVKCYRCGKEIPQPITANADYIIAKDTIVFEKREKVKLILTKRKTTKEGKVIVEDKVETVEHPEIAHKIIEEHKKRGYDIDKLETVFVDEPVQKTAIICKDCYRDGDIVIWGYHKRRR